MKYCNDSEVQGLSPQLGPLQYVRSPSYYQVGFVDGLWVVADGAGVHQTLLTGEQRLARGDRPRLVLIKQEDCFDLLTVWLVQQLLLYSVIAS